MKNLTLLFIASLLSACSTNPHHSKLPPAQPPVTAGETTSNGWVNPDQPIGVEFISTDYQNDLSNSPNNNDAASNVATENSNETYNNYTIPSNNSDLETADTHLPLNGKNTDLNIGVNKPEKNVSPIDNFKTAPYKQFQQTGVASWYGPGFHGKRTANGETFDMYSMTAAHLTLPLSSYVRVTNPANGLSVIVKVNDRGPYAKGRIIDLSYAAAAKLNLIQKGFGFVELEVVHKSEANENIPDKKYNKKTKNKSNKLVGLN